MFIDEMLRSVSNLSKLLLVLVLMAIVGQSVVCLAENADLLPCSHENSSSSESDQSPEKRDSGGCKHPGCQKLVSIPQTQASMMALDRRPAAYFAVLSLLPDAPVSEIDYPPQLS